MKIGIPVVFLIILASLGGFYGYQSYEKKHVAPETRSKTVVPQVASSPEKEEKTHESDDASDENRIAFLNLANDETLIDSLAIDFDGDGHEDQITVIKTSASPNIVLVISLYDGESGGIERKATIKTPISQVRTFSVTAIDVIGNHTNALVYQGVTDSGNSVLKIFTGKKNRKGDLNLREIGNFETDGTITIQQSDRSEPYALSRAKGESFPVWVSATEEDAETKKVYQLQLTYNYDEKAGVYVETHQSRVSQGYLQQLELRKIQDGTVKTFAGFLDGLWYKTENSGKSIRYLYFDYSNREIVFLFQDSEEVYSWNNSTLRRNGIYLTTVNTSIGNLQRRFDIVLVSTDSIRLKLQDDVRMLIKENNIWDGTYKKMNESGVSLNNAEVENFLEALEKGKVWESSEGYILKFQDGFYSVEATSSSESGMSTKVVISSTSLLQFRNLKRSDNANPAFLNGVFEARFDILEPARPATKKLKARGPVYDEKTIILSPVIISPTGFYKNDSRTITLKNISDK